MTSRRSASRGGAGFGWLGGGRDRDRRPEDIRTRLGGDRSPSGETGWGARIRTWEWRYQKPLPYHLATPQRAAPSRTRRRLSQQPSRPLHRPRDRSGTALDNSAGAARSLLRPGPALAISRPPVDRSVAQPGRAPRSGRGGRRFKSCHSDHWIQRRLPTGRCSPSSQSGTFGCDACGQDASGQDARASDARASQAPWRAFSPAPPASAPLAFRISLRPAML